MAMNRTCTLLALAAALSSTACNERVDPPTSPQYALLPGCNVTLTRLSPNPQVVTHNTTGHVTSWHIRNNATTAITLTGQTLKKTGNVTAVHPDNWVNFPYTLAAGSLIDADLTYDVGAVGNGSVSMTVSASCGSFALPGYSVTIQ